MDVPPPSAPVSPDPMTPAVSGEPVGAPPPGPRRRDRLPVVVMAVLIVLFVLAGVAAVMALARACGDDGPDESAPRRGVPVAGLSGVPSPTGATATGAGPDEPGPAESSPAPSPVVAPTAVTPPGQENPTPARWPGTWVIVGDPLAGIVIEEAEDGAYPVHAPDSSESVTFYPLGDDRLMAVIVPDGDDEGPVRIILTMQPDGERLTLEQMEADGSKTWELRRED